MSKTDCEIGFKREMTEKYFDMVYRLALARTKDKDMADDVCQEVFLRYIKSDKSFDSEEHIKAWLIRVAINCSKSIAIISLHIKSVLEVHFLQIAATIGNLFRNIPTVSFIAISDIFNFALNSAATISKLCLNCICVLQSLITECADCIIN